jgi:hypothetical protein
MIIASSQYPSRHCDEYRVGWCVGRRSNLKLSTIQVRKEIASSLESFRDPRNDVIVLILIS